VKRLLLAPISYWQIARKY